MKNYFKFLMLFLQSKQMDKFQIMMKTLRNTFDNETERLEAYRRYESKDAVLKIANKIILVLGIIITIGEMISIVIDFVKGL